jgi:hypothetical protein
MPVKPGRVVPRQRGAVARRVRACARPLHRRGEARLGWERHKGRSASGTVQVSRKDAPGSCGASWLGNHGAACCCGHGGQGRWPQAWAM